jgi:hypothetical protein
MKRTMQLTMFDVPPIEYRQTSKRNNAIGERVGIFQHVGAGTQSSAIVYMTLDGLLPPPNAFLFADTGDEPASVYQHVEYLRELVKPTGIPFEIVKRSEGGLVADAMGENSRYAAMPMFLRNPETGKVSQLRRQCTSEYKVIPLTNYILNWMLERDYAKVVIDKNGKVIRRVRSGVFIEDWYGLSYEEFYRLNNSRDARWQRSIYPLMDMRVTRVGCIKYAMEHGYRIPGKSSCRICPFHDNNYWLDLFLYAPADFESACVFDDWIRTPEAKTKILQGVKDDAFLHSSCVPLREIDFAVLVANKNAAPLLDLCGANCMT